MGYGQLGTHGALGFEGLRVNVNGRAFDHALSMHPPPVSRGAASAQWDLSALAAPLEPGSVSQPAAGAGKPATWRWFEAKVAINDHNNVFGRAGSPLNFAVVADGHELWRSRPVQRTGEVQSTGPLDVSAAHQLRLEVHAEGSNACAHAVWLQPRLFT